MVELVTSGLSYEEAAAEVGFRSRSAAWKAFHKALADREADAIDEHRALELSRLDALQQPIWERAVTGDFTAANAVLRIIEARMRLLGLDRPTKTSAGPRSIIAAGCEEEFAEALAATQSRNRDGGSEG